MKVFMKVSDSEEQTIPVSPISTLKTHPPFLNAVISLSEYCAVNCVVPETPSAGETEIRELSNQNSSSSLTTLVLTIGILTVSVKRLAVDLALKAHQNSTSMSASRLALGITSLFLSKATPFNNLLIREVLVSISTGVSESIAQICEMVQEQVDVESQPLTSALSVIDSSKDYFLVESKERGKTAREVQVGGIVVQTPGVVSEQP